MDSVGEEIKNKLLDYLNRTDDFLLEQCPEIMQQALRYHWISSIVELFICLTIMTVCLFIAYNCFFRPKLDKNGSRELSSTVGCAISGLLIWVFFLGFLQSANTLIKIWIAPKYFLLHLIAKGIE